MATTDGSAVDTGNTIRWRGQMCKGFWSTPSAAAGSAEMTVTETAIRIRSHSYAPWDFTIQKESVQQIEPAGFFPWFWFGVRIRHLDTALPKSLKFQTWHASRREIFDACQTRGYPIREH